MKKVSCDLLDSLQLFQLNIFGDNRGHFIESYNKKEFDKLLGEKINFVQDNFSLSKKGTIRGLHYQRANPQAKLIRVIKGKILDVAVDLRIQSANYGKSSLVELSSDNNFVFWIPEGFAHGFQVLSSYAEVSYKVNNFWDPNDEYTLSFHDKDLKIEWADIPTIASNKDYDGLSLKTITEKELYL
jgi:dTDP-4-dehydrorhamnose 3,5-epimerase